MNRLPAPKNKPKTNPILSAVGGFRKPNIACRKIRLTPNPQNYTQDSCVLRIDVVFYSNLRSGM